jgi:hypothetical protein
LAFLALAAAALVVGVYYYRNPAGTIKIRLRWLVTLMAIVSMILTIAGIINLQSEIATTRWTAIEGEIITSEVIGQRAFHPMITYSYSTNGQNFSNTSTLDTPGFGGKRNRLELAEYLVARYPAGSSITVYVDPDQPSVSELTVGMTYRTLLETVLGLILMVGTIVAAGRLFRKL